LEPSNVPVVVAETNKRHANRTALCCSGVTQNNNITCCNEILIEICNLSLPLKAVQIQIKPAILNKSKTGKLRSSQILINMKNNWGAIKKAVITPT